MLDIDHRRGFAYDFKQTEREGSRTEEGCGLLVEVVFELHVNIVGKNRADCKE